MFEISVKEDFSSAHNLRGYKGKCESLHGHNWQVEVIVFSKKLDKIGMVMDFKKLKEIVHKSIKDLDHTYLNDIAYFKKVNPTSENIAKYIFNKISPLVKKESVALKSVSVWESQDSKATYSA
ncbi:MAG: 6-carboxytetrahydropterin synthase QueD [Candidatus Omnitrophica bacterium]|nr:6-carboxytetrahydropterin synthase QueD [Candidatus Omnitrophota bacterium]